MDLFTDAIQGLYATEKLRLVERIWDDLSAHDDGIPLPDWVGVEVARRRDEMVADPQFGMMHHDLWARIASSRNC